jgi:hypothetical protein
MGLHHSEWLRKAERLAVNQTQRTYHKDENRPNLVVRNLPDRYTAYCHKCGEGAVHLKQHAQIGSAVGVQTRTMKWPSDACDLSMLPEYTAKTVYSFLLSKRLDVQVMAPDLPVKYSVKQARIILGCSMGWLGRAHVNQQPKWCNYENDIEFAVHLQDTEFKPVVVLVEDYVSALIVRWAMPEVTCVALLGTALRSNTLIMQLTKAKQVLGFFDGDAAGRKGDALARVRLQGLGINYSSVPTPVDHDPKDLDKLEIQSLLRGCYHA